MMPLKSINKITSSFNQQKKFYKIGHRGLHPKTFYGHNYATSGVFLYDFDWITPIVT
jgi:hypothetical protein